jgi:hypothetical protein
VNRGLGGSKDNSKRCAGEKNMWAGDWVGPRAILKDMQERKHLDRGLGGSKGNSKRYSGEKNM